MKNNVLIAMHYLQPGACIVANRSEWILIHVTTPRKSCEEALQRRNTLRTMLPHDTRKVNGHIVRKNGKSHQKKQYIIDGKYYTFEDAIALIETAAPAGTVTIQLPLGLEVAS